MMKTMLETCSKPEEIEILIAMDEDDEETVDYVRNKDFGIEKYLQVTKRSTHFTKDYINPLARKAKGRWLITINDDCDFQTKGWDKIIHYEMNEKSDEYKDDVIIGLIRDEIPRYGENERFPHFSSFPVVGKEFVTALGYLQDERCYVWGADHVLADVFRMWNKNRMVSLTHVTIGHLSTHTGRRKVNENYEYFQQIDQDHKITIGKFNNKITMQAIIEYLNNRGLKK